MNFALPSFFIFIFTISSSKANFKSWSWRAPPQFKPNQTSYGCQISLSSYCGIQLTIIRKYVYSAARRLCIRCAPAWRHYVRPTYYTSCCSKTWKSYGTLNSFEEKLYGWMDGSDHATRQRMMLLADAIHQCIRCMLELTPAGRWVDRLKDADSDRINAPWT